MNHLLQIAVKLLPLSLCVILTTDLNAQAPLFAHAGAFFQLTFENNSSVLSKSHMQRIDEEANRVLGECGSEWVSEALIHVETARVQQVTSHRKVQVMGERVENVRAYMRHFGTRPPSAHIYESLNPDRRPKSQAPITEDVVDVRISCSYRRSENQ